MRALKFIVVTLAVLIVIAIAALVYGVLHRFEEARQPAETPPERAAAAAIGEPASFGTIRETLPPEAEVGAVTLDGDRMVVEILLPDGGVHLLLFDAARGTRLGTIELAPGR